MKSSQKVTKLKLNIEQDNNYILLGLVSAEPDYKLSLSVNKKLGISLKNIASLVLPGDNNSELTFSRFSNSDDPTDLTFCLISNRTDKNFFLSKLKNVDYLLQIQNSERNADLNKLILSLREINTITAVFKIDPNTIKEKNLHYLNQ
jgi:hypothetical protein